MKCEICGNDKAAKLFISGLNVEEGKRVACDKCIRAEQNQKPTQGRGGEDSNGELTND